MRARPTAVPARRVGLADGMAVFGCSMPRMLLPAVLFLLRPSEVAAGSANATRTRGPFDEAEDDADNTGLIVGMSVGGGVLLIVLIYCWLTRRTSARLSLRRPGPRMTGGFVHGASKNSPLDMIVGRDLEDKDDDENSTTTQAD